MSIIIQFRKCYLVSFNNNKDQEERRLFVQVWNLVSYFEEEHKLQVSENKNTLRGMKRAF
jgi:hypothetical protein